MPKSKTPTKATAQASAEFTKRVAGFLEGIAAREHKIWSRSYDGLDKLGAKAIPSLIEILTGRDPAGRENDMLRVHGALYIYSAQLADPSVAKALIQVLNDPHPGVRSMASQALSRVAPAAKVKIPDVAIAQVIHSLKMSSPGHRYGPAMAMNELAVVVKHRAAPAVPALIEILSTRDWEVRCAALASLRHIGPASAPAVPELLRLVKQDPHKEVRRSAAHGLQEIGAPAAKAMPALIAALKDKQVMVRQAAVEALGSYGPAARKAKPALEKLLQDRPPLRKAATAALNQIMG
jgi:HEAT repeat protein